VTAIAVPLVSVITPTYNRADLVLRAVRSVLEQTEADLELLIIDDGSTDGTAEVLGAVDDPRVHVLAPGHVGLSRARNLGIAAAGGTWIAFLDDDNEWRPTYLERQLAAAVARPDAVAVYCPAQEVRDETGRVLREAPWYTTEGDLFPRMMRRGYPRVSATMVRRATVLEAGGFAPDLPVAADCQLFLRVALLGPFARSPEPLAIRHFHAGGHLSTLWPKQRESYWIQAPRLRPLIVRRGGHRAWATWLRWHPGEAEMAVIRTTPAPERRAVARSALGRLARYLPWSAPAMLRPLLIVVLGPHAMDPLRHWYRSAHRALRGGPHAPRRRTRG